MTRVLDHDALDAAADRMLGGARVDLATVHAAARRRARVRRRRAWVGSASAVAAVAASIVLLAGGAVPGVALPQPEPAAPTGPGELPDVVRIPPRWTPSATERPLSRVAYAVLDTRPQEPGQLIWLVGADGGEYRSLPSEDPHRVAVSADGSRVAWVEESPKGFGGYGQQAELVKILDVREGVVRQVSLPGAAGWGFAVEGTAFAPAGSRLAVWGADRVGPESPPLQRLYVIDAGASAPAATRVCDCGPTPREAGYAFTAGGRYVTGRGTGDGGAVPRRPAVNDPDEPEVGLGSTVFNGQLMISPDGRTRYEVAGAQLTGAGDRGRETFRYTLRAWPETGTAPRPVADLGEGTVALPLGAAGGAALVARWSTEQVVERRGTGPGAVLLVRPEGGVRELSASEGSARVIAVAGAVAGEGRVVPAAEEGSRATSASWYGWHARRVAGAVTGWVAGLPFWMVALAGAVLLGVALRVMRPWRAGRTGRAVLGAVAVLAVAAVAGSCVLLLAGALLGSPAAGTAAPPGATPVVPRVLADQHRVPPRAFDDIGRPATRRIAVLFAGEVAGREGTYGTDAATGRTVRIDDLPGLQEGTEQVTWTVSPNGRWLASEHGVVDLETARVHPFGLPASRSVSVVDDGTTAAIDESENLLLAPVAGKARTVSLPDRSEESILSFVTAHPGGQLLVGVAPGPEDERTVLVDARTGAVTPLVLRVAWGIPAAVTPSGGIADARGTVHDPLSHVSVWNGGTVLRALEASTARRLVAVGPGPGGPVSLLRAPEGSPLRWQSLATVHLADLSSLELAGDVVGNARAVDVDEPWWAVVAGPGLRTVADRVLVAGLFGLLLAAAVTAMSRRPRPFTGAGGGLSPRPGRSDPPGPS